MAIFGKLFGRAARSGPVSGIAAKAGVEQTAAGSANFDKLTAQQLAQMKRSALHPISITSRVAGISGTLVQKFAVYGKYAGMLAFVLPATHKALSQGNFETLEEYDELKANANSAKGEKKGVGAVWHAARVKPHNLLAGIENILQTVTFNRLSEGREKEGSVGKGVFAVLKNALKHSVGETQKLDALQKEEAEAKAKEAAKANGKEEVSVTEEAKAMALSSAVRGSFRSAFNARKGAEAGNDGAEHEGGDGVGSASVSGYLQANWERMKDVSGMKDRFVGGVKDTSLLAGAAKVSQVAGTTVNTYNTVSGFFNNLKVLQLEHLQNTGKPIGKLKLLFFPGKLPDTVKMARKELIGVNLLAGAVNTLSMGISAYVVQKKLPAFALNNPQTYIVGAGQLLNMFVTPMLNNKVTIADQLRGLNYENPDVGDYAAKLSVLHPGLRDAGLGAEHPMVQKVAEHLLANKVPLSSVSGLIESGWADRAMKETAQNMQKSAAQPQQAAQGASLPAHGFAAAEDKRREGAAPRRETPSARHTERVAAAAAAEEMALSGSR